MVLAWDTPPNPSPSGTPPNRNKTPFMPVIGGSRALAMPLTPFFEVPQKRAWGVGVPNPGLRADVAGAGAGWAATRGRRWHGQRAGKAVPRVRKGLGCGRAHA